MSGIKKGVIINLLFIALALLVGLGECIKIGNLKPVGESLVYIGGFSIFGWLFYFGCRIFLD